MTVPESTSHTKRIIGLFPELLGVGGIQEAGRLTAAALKEIALQHGWSTDFLSLNDSRGSRSFDANKRTIRLRCFGRGKLDFLLSGVGSARSLGKNGTCIVLAAHPNLAVVAAWIQRISPRTCTIVMAHGVEVWAPLALFRRRALLRANLVLSPSTDTAQKLVSVQGVPRERVRKLPWPINPRFLRLADSPSSLSVPAGFPQGRVILTVGRWAASERYKGADELIRTVAQLRSAVSGLNLVAVGSGDDLPRLRELAASLGVTDCVHFLENLSREQVAACYAHADVFALPSTGEGFGLVFLEAMAFAKPVVGTAFGGIMDLVENGVNGLLVPPCDTDQLGAALGRLLGDKSLCMEMGQRGAEIVRHRYEFGLFQNVLEQMLKDCGLDPMDSA